MPGKQAQPRRSPRFSTIRFRQDPAPGERYPSGSLVFDEAFAAGRLVTRYWNPNGQLWPEMHYAALVWGPNQPADTFRIAINGQDLAGGWQWVDGKAFDDVSRWRRRAGANVTHYSSPAAILSVHDILTTGVRIRGLPFFTALVGASTEQQDGCPFLIRPSPLLQVARGRRQPRRSARRRAAGLRKAQSSRSGSV